MNLRGKGGQPKSPNGPALKLISQAKTHSSKTLRFKLNSPVILELLANLVTQILECAGM